MTCDDCKFYGKECESHSQVRMIGKEHNMEICEIFCPKFVDCMECTRFKACQALGELTGRLTSCPDFRQKPKTNADRIRAMTDEELAAFMFSMVDCVSCENKLMNNGKLVFGEKRKTCTDKDYHAMCNGDGRKCEAVCLKWLQQPAEGD